MVNGMRDGFENGDRADDLLGDLSGIYKRILVDMADKFREAPIVPEDDPNNRYWTVDDPRTLYVLNPDLWEEYCEGPIYSHLMNAPQIRLVRKASPTLKMRIEEALEDKPQPRGVIYGDLGADSDGVIANAHLREIADYVFEYTVIDVVPKYLEGALESVRGNFPKESIRCSFENLSLPRREGYIYVLELGPTYGNFDHEKINSILLRNMHEDGIALVSAQIISGEGDRRRTKKAYKEGGFNQQMLFLLLKAIGFGKSDFTLEYYFRNSYLTIAAKVCNVPEKFKDTALEPGDYVELLRSWKPTKPEFEWTLSRHFDIDVFYSRGVDYRFAILRPRREENRYVSAPDKRAYW
jgi:hypothetical protein